MKFYFAFVAVLLVFISSQPIQAREMVDMQNVKLRSLDKITARTVTFDVKVGSTVTFGDLFIKVQSCRNNQPLDEPESASFLQVWEGSDDQKSEPHWVFSGWMFASSPGLSYMDHPVYDVWVLECFNDSQPTSQTPPPSSDQSGDASTNETQETQTDTQTETNPSDENEDSDVLLSDDGVDEENTRTDDIPVTNIEE